MTGKDRRWILKALAGASLLAARPSAAEELLKSAKGELDANLEAARGELQRRIKGVRTLHAIVEKRTTRLSPAAGDSQSDADYDDGVHEIFYTPTAYLDRSERNGFIFELRVRPPVQERVVLNLSREPVRPAVRSAISSDAEPSALITAMFPLLTSEAATAELVSKETLVVDQGMRRIWLDVPSLTVRRMLYRNDRGPQQDTLFDDYSEPVPNVPYPFRVTDRILKEDLSPIRTIEWLTKEVILNNADADFESALDW